MIETQTNFSLRDFNTMQVEVQSSFFIEINSINDLKELLVEKDYQTPLYILGGGSNVVFLKDFEGTILYINILGREVIRENDSHVWVKANAGENWHEFVIFTLENDFGGLENLSLIPGKVGASPMQNIGAYGVEIKDVFVELEAMEIATGELKTFSHEECKFGYRESVFKNDLKGQYIITSVSFRLTKKAHVIKTSYGAIQSQLADMGIEEPSIQEVSQAVIAIRESKLPNPKDIPNTGSFFKNPSILNEEYMLLQRDFSDIPGYPLDSGLTKVPAGWLIEKSGWKGFRNDKVGVHERQALVLINHSNGSGQNVYDLSEQILRDVEKKFGIELEREVNIIS